MYEYMANVGGGNSNLAKKYFTALGRERFGKYRIDNSMYNNAAGVKGVDVLKEEVGIISEL